MFNPNVNSTGNISGSKYKELNHNNINNYANNKDKNAVDKRFKTLPTDEILPMYKFHGLNIFVCINDTMQMDLKRLLFGLPPRYRDSVSAITRGLPMFLYNLHEIWPQNCFAVQKLPLSRSYSQFCPDQPRIIPDLNPRLSHHPLIVPGERRPLVPRLSLHPDSLWHPSRELADHGQHLPDLTVHGDFRSMFADVESDLSRLQIADFSPPFPEFAYNRPDLTVDVESDLFDECSPSTYLQSRGFAGLSSFFRQERGKKRGEFLLLMQCASSWLLSELEDNPSFQIARPFYTDELVVHELQRPYGQNETLYSNVDDYRGKDPFDLIAKLIKDGGVDLPELQYFWPNLRENDFSADAAFWLSVLDKYNERTDHLNLEHDEYFRTGLNFLSNNRR